MANVGTLSIKFTGDAKQLEQTFTRVGVKANLFAGAISSGLKTAAQAAVEFAKSSIRIAAENEQTLTSFTNLTGSISAAKALYKDLLDFSSRTPFSSKEIQSGATTLLGFGLNAKEATAAIKDLGAAAAANADTDLKRLVVSFGQIQGANVAMTKDLREFVNNGIPIYQLLSETLGVSVDKINEMASAGEITGDVITRVFREAASEGGRFEKTLDSQSKTLNGLISTLKDNFAIVLGQIGEKLLPVLKDAVLAANDALLDFRERIDAGELNPFIAGIATLTKSFGVIKDAARDAAGTMIALFDAANAVYQLAKGNFQEAWDSASKAVSEYGRAVSSVFKLDERLAEVTATYRQELNKLNLETAAADDFFSDYARNLSQANEETKKIIPSTEEAKKKIEDKTEATRKLNSELSQYAANLDLILQALNRASDNQSIPQTLPGRDFNVSRKPPGVSSNVDELSEEERINRENQALERQATALDIAATAFAAYGNAVKSNLGKGDEAITAHAKAFLSASKEIIGALIREGVAAAVTGSLKTAGKTGPFAIALAAAAGAASQALFNAILGSLKIPAFGDGGVVYGPTLALIGEKGPEEIVPLGKGRNNRPIPVNIRGVQYGIDTYWQNANVGIAGRMIYGPQ